MDISAKMPATMDSTLPAQMPSTMNSEAAHTGDNGSDDAPVTPVSLQIASQRVSYESVNEVGEKWQTADKKTGKCGDWEACERIEGNKGGLPQRDPDNDGDLN